MAKIVISVISKNAFKMVAMETVKMKVFWEKIKVAPHPEMFYWQSFTMVLNFIALSLKAQLLP